MQKAGYFCSFLTVSAVIVCGIVVVAIMVKRKTFFDTEWRVKATLIAYALGGIMICSYFVITKLVTYKANVAISVVMLAACSWSSVHWQVTVYYLRTACLLRVSLDQ